jgi:hypothetical protein
VTAKEPRIVLLVSLAGFVSGAGLLFSAANGFPVGLAYMFVCALGMLSCAWLISLALRPAGSRRFRLLMLVPMGALPLLLQPPFTLELVWRGRLRRFEPVVERARPLIEAVERYERDRGSPPEELESLVPDYLDRIPSTGVRWSPQFQYFSVGPGEWHLYVPAGWLDEFAYDPEFEFGDPADRIGPWVYWRD